MSTDPKSTYYDHGGIEVLDIIRAKLTSEQMVGYLLGNVLKYASRLNWKGASERDAEKLSLYAMWLHEELAPPPAERQEQVRERHDFSHIPAWEPHQYQPPVTFDDYCQIAIDAEVRRVDEERQKAQRPPDRPIASHCPDGGACRHKCGLEPCKAQP